VLDEIVDELVTDKTGTLTENSLVLTHLAIGQQLFEVAHNMEMLSSFPDQDLIKAMSFCHDVTPRSGEMLFSTVEDLKFVIFAKMCGYHLVDRTPNQVSVAHNDVILRYDVLHFNEFESRKKRILQCRLMYLPNRHVHYSTKAFT
jgi:magnesium-transporting ATPase (P-type)